MDLKSSSPLPGAIALHTNKQSSLAFCTTLNCSALLKFFKGVFSWELRGSRFIFCAVRSAMVSIAELYVLTVSVTKGVGEDTASVPGVQPGVAGLF